MIMQTTPTGSSMASQRSSLHTLDTLAERTGEELDALYRAATVPTTMHSADGQLVGRMLAVRGIPPALRAPLKRWAASPSFVWEGKTFQADSDARGTGHNRVYVPGVFGHQNLFPFATSFEPSSVDGKPALILDYDLDVNPGYIRRIHDEIREVAPGLFLGPAMWKGRKAKALVLWFALDSRLS
jgi:hypothetical protein